MDEQGNPNLIIEVTIMKHGISAEDRKGNKYKIESIILGAGYHRRAIKYEAHLTENCECRAEVLPNGKLNIINSI